MVNRPSTETGVEDRLVSDEQAALRRVAMLDAGGATSPDLCAAVVEEVVSVLGAPAAWLLRYEAGHAMTVLAALNDPAFPIGSRWQLDGSSVTSRIFDSGRPVRIDDFSGLDGAIAARTRSSGFVSALGVPIVVDGSVWGAVCVGTTDAEPLPVGTEDRLQEFTDLVAIAISNAESLERRRLLADEQAALHRVAALVARDVPTGELFAVVADEVARSFGLAGIEVWRNDADETAVVVATAGAHTFTVGSRWPLDGPSVIEAVRRTGEAARIDDFTGLPGTIAAARRAEVMAAVGAPIVVEGEVWGSIIAVSIDADPVPDATETRLKVFTELVATAISNRRAHNELQSLAEEQAALRRVATLVAEGAPEEDLFTAVAQEVGNVLHVSGTILDWYEADGTAVTLATAHDEDWDAADLVAFPGRRWPSEPGSLSRSVFETRRTARIDDYASLLGVTGDAARQVGVGSGAAGPIIVDGRLWGLIRVFSRFGETLPAGIEDRLVGFTELVATAISNLQARHDLQRLAEEQAALRRVATLVAEGAGSTDVFDAVCAETGLLVGAASVNLSHYTPDGFNVTVAGWSESGDIHVPVGTRYPLTPDTVGGVIVRTRATARIDSWEDAASELGRLVRARGIRSSLGAPVVVEGQIWGALVAASDREEPLAEGTELRLARFTELIATTISNAASRSELIASRARIVAAGDEARRRIERNLHDGTQQRLIALGLDLQRIRAQLPNNQQEADAGLERMERDLESVLEDVRELSRGLHPPLLARRGLGPSLRALTRRSPIPVDLEIELDERPPAPVETALYYIVSEALTNAIRHSQASLISVSIAPDPDGASPSLRATIADDGVGGAAPVEGSGLIGLVDRVDALGGRLVLESTQGAGTRISIVLPLAPISSSTTS